MAVEPCIPTEVTYRGAALDGAFVFTLYDPQSDAPRGALTTRNPLPAGERGGPLIVRGTRAGHGWLVRLPEVEVVDKTALGCEFRIHGEPVREVLADAPGPTGAGTAAVAVGGRAR